MMIITDRVFADMAGLPCWGVNWEPQLGLSMNFGQPRLVVREPYKSRASSPRVRRSARYRNVKVRGAWWLWSWCGRWRLTLRDADPVTQAASARRILQALIWLEGQRFTAIHVNVSNGATELEFDLGAQLRIRGSSSDNGGLWSLYRPNGHVLVVRSDGHYSHERSTRAEKWRPLASRPAV